MAIHAGGKALISPPQTAAGLLALIIAGVFTAFGSSHKPPPPVPFPSAFEDLPKGDKLASAEPEPRIVKVIPVTKPAAEPIPEANPKDEAPKDICEKLGGWKKKVYRHHHEGWRCAFPRRQK